MIEIVHQTIDIGKLSQSVGHPSAGGIVLFIGTTRDHAHGKEVQWLEYEAYEPMALKTMREIAEQANQKWDLQSVSVIHRIGKVNIGEASIAIAVSSAHRNEAFEACRFIIDTLKKIVPIWKKEVYADGEVWIGLEGKPMIKSDP